jgi:predicted component of type VI protein secretion system
MDDHKTVSVSRVYVPSEYVLYLSPADREQFRGYESSLLEELSAYLAEHARREGYALVAVPSVTLLEDTDLSIGEFGIATRIVHAPTATPPAPAPLRTEPAPEINPTPPPAPASVPIAAGPQAPQADPGGTRVFEREQLAAPVIPVGPGPVRQAVLVLAGVRRQLDRPAVVLGRSKECDLVVDDPSASRRHAEVRGENGDYWLIDLGSTNGTEVNGKRVDRAKLEPGDVITVGQTRVTFELLAT